VEVAYTLLNAVNAIPRNPDLERFTGSYQSAVSRITVSVAASGVSIYISETVTIFGMCCDFKLGVILSTAVLETAAW
jgi:hypothetical protein